MTQLKITRGKGFHLNFENGVTMSVQIGGGNYCENYDEPSFKGNCSGYSLPASSNAEIAIWGRDKDMINVGKHSLDDGCAETVKGWVAIDDIIDVISTLRALPDGICGDDISKSIETFRCK